MLICFLFFNCPHHKQIQTKICFSFIFLWQTTITSHQQDMPLCHVEVFSKPTWWQVMTYTIFWLIWLPFMTFVWPWWPMVTTFWWPWRPMVKTLLRPDDWWWRHLDDPFYNSRLPCDYPACHWWPLWQHWWPLWYSLSPWLKPSDEKDDKVMTRTTNDLNWWHYESCVMTDMTTPHDMWRPKWRPKYDPNDPDDNVWLPLMMHVTTCWWPWKLFDGICNIYHQVESCLSCRDIVFQFFEFRFG